jgi:hypothetical protein
MHSKCLDFFHFSFVPNMFPSSSQCVTLRVVCKLKLISPLWMIYKALKNLVVQAPIDISEMTCKLEYG